MKRKTSPCQTCKHTEQCLEKIKRQHSQTQYLKCGYKNKPLNTTPLINYHKKLLNNIHSRTPETCLKHIIPTGMTTTQTVCQLCAHHVWNCIGKRGEP